MFRTSWFWYGGPTRAPHGVHAEYERVLARLSFSKSGCEWYSRFRLSNLDPVGYRERMMIQPALRAARIHHKGTDGSRSDEDLYLPQGPSAPRIPVLRSCSAAAPAVAVRAAPWDLAWYRGQVLSDRTPPLHRSSRLTPLSTCTPLPLRTSHAPASLAHAPPSLHTPCGKHGSPSPRYLGH